VEQHRGGLTFVFTDIEGSTQLVRDVVTGYGLALRIHRRILQTCFEEQAGKEMGTEGDGMFYVFSDPGKAVAASVTAQHKLEHYAWPEGMRLRIRMGIHCGPVRISNGTYVGLTVHEAARISAAAHGGQILCSEPIASEARKLGDQSVLLRDLGHYVLRGIPESRSLYQLSGPGLEDDFPPPREAVREGGVRVTIWQRDPMLAGQQSRLRIAVTLEELDVQAQDDDVRTEISRASNGPVDAFRLIVRRDGRIEEEYDGLTIGGATDAAAIVNAHSQLIRIGNA
jgi:class 3 adenylate cyclase